MTAVTVRAMSSFPISIGTSLAMETFFEGRQVPFDPDREIPKRVDVANYQNIYVNIATLMRNLFGAMEKVDSDLLSIIDIVDTLIGEMDVIDSLFAVEGKGVCVPVYYYNTHEHVVGTNRYRNVQFRKVNTDNAKNYEKLEKHVVKNITTNSDKVKKYSELITPKERNKALVLTHQAFDLLSRKYFSQLDLIESHTGKLKPYNMWASKYNPLPSEDMNNLPFNNILLFIFGDRTLIQPLDIKLRKLVKEISVKNNWLPITTRDKVLFDLERGIKEPFVLEYIRGFPTV